MKLGLGLGFSNQQQQWQYNPALLLDGVLPSLALDFANDRYAINSVQKPLLDIITYVNAGGGTYFDKNGLLKTAVANTLRLDHDPATGVSKGALIENLSTGLITYSNASDANWLNGVANVTDLSGNYLGFFDGLLVASNGATWNRQNAPAVNVVSGVDYACNVFVVKGTSGEVRISLRDNTAATQTLIAGVFDSPTVTSSPAGSATVLETINYIKDGEEYTLLKIRFTPNFTGSCTLGISPNSSVVGENIVALGATMEQASYASSFIYTNGSTVTRAADNPYIDGTNLTDFFSPLEGTLFIKFNKGVAESNNYLLSANDGTSGELIAIAFDSTVSLKGFIRDGFVTQSDLFATAYVDNSISKAALAYKLNDSVLSVDGVLSATDTSNTLPTVDTLTIGDRGDGLRRANVHIKGIRYYLNRGLDASLPTFTGA